MKSGLAIQRNGAASLPAHAIKRTNYTEIFHGSGKMALTPAEHGSTMTRRTSGSLCGSDVREGGRIRRRASSAEDSLHRQKTNGPPRGAVWFLLAEYVFGDRHRDYVKPPFRCFDLLAGAQTAVRNRLTGRITQLLNRRLDMQRSLCRLVCPTN